MDPLDRLTNRSALEAEMAKLEDETDINAEELAAYIKSKVIGQDRVADDVAKQVRYRFAQSDLTKPIGVFCFAGPPGVGKTYFAEVLTEKLYKSKKSLVFLDMNQYSEPHAASAMFGVGGAGEYTGDRYGILTRALRDYPKAVVLLDEFEKAHSSVHKKFLTAWNDGFIIVPQGGEKISTTQAIFILTTNAAADLIGQHARTYAEQRDQLLKASKTALRESGFAPEVLSRIDQVFAFSSLAGLDIARVVGLEIEKLVSRYKLELAPGGIDPVILARAIQRSKDLQAGGVRELARAFESELAESIMDAKAQGAKTIRLVDGPDGIRAEIETYKDTR